MDSLRPIDVWFIENVLVYETTFRERARRLTNASEEAEDLLQDSYAKVIALDNWRMIDNPRAYLLRVMRNLAFERMRRARLVRFEKLSDLNSYEPEDDTPDAFRIAAGRKDVAIVLETIERLPAPNREVVRMRRIEEKSPRDIAHRLGLSLSTVEKRLARGLYLIAQSLGKASETPKLETPSVLERKRA